MPKNQINQFDATAANNTDLESISCAEGMAPSSVNNWMRGMMRLQKLQDVGTHAMTSPVLTSVTINGGAVTGITDITVADGGTGASRPTRLTNYRSATRPSPTAPARNPPARTPQTRPWVTSSMPRPAAPTRSPRRPPTAPWSFYIRTTPVLER